MLDGRHAPDTWFIVAEQDFRFYAKDDIGNWAARMGEVPAGVDLWVSPSAITTHIHHHHTRLHANQ